MKLTNQIPKNFVLLHEREEELRAKACNIIAENKQLSLHLSLTEHAMDVLDVLRQAPIDDEDLKVIQGLGIRSFNRFASAIKLMLSGYSQGAALLLRDVLETVFLVDYFTSNPADLTIWRTADKVTRKRKFKPVKIREALDARDGVTGQKRRAMYETFSELAAHPSMESFAMLRTKGMGIQSGPFVEQASLEAVLSEIGRLADLVGEVFGHFLPKDSEYGIKTINAFRLQKIEWTKEFYTLSKEQ